MSKDLVLCFDGTSNRFGVDDTNVARLAAAAMEARPGQFVFYDPGVGTRPQPGFVSAVGRWWSVVAGLAFGAGLEDNVSDGYSFLMRSYEEGDRVWIFGFSRGAYTARVLAGVLCEFGLLHRDADNLLPYVMDMARAAMHADTLGQRRAYWNTVREFGGTFARSDAAPHRAPRAIRVHFLGVWDTVSSVGWVLDPQTYPFTTENPAVDHVRHAVAIDERRAFFRQKRVETAKPDSRVAGAPPAKQDVVQLWFAGHHCDVGGGNVAASSGAWIDAYDWMTNEAMALGLALDSGRLAAQREAPSGAVAGWRTVLVNSMRGAWLAAEFFPKLTESPFDPWWMRVRVGVFDARKMKEGDVLAPAAVERIRTTTYRPRQLADAAVERIRALPAGSGPARLTAADVARSPWASRKRELVLPVALLAAAAAFYAFVVAPAAAEVGVARDGEGFFHPRFEFDGAALRARLSELAPRGLDDLKDLLRGADRVFPLLGASALFAWAILGAKWLQARSRIVGVLLVLPVAAMLADYAENSVLMEAVEELRRRDEGAAKWAAVLTSVKWGLYALSTASAGLLVLFGTLRACFGGKSGAGGGGRTSRNGDPQGRSGGSSVA